MELGAHMSTQKFLDDYAKRYESNQEKEIGLN